MTPEASMTAAALLTALTRECEQFASAVERAGPEPEVPSCPGWRMRDLALHQGTVHRWATGFVSGPVTGYVPFPTVSAPDAGLPDWLREGARRLADVLGEAPEDLECFTLFGGSPTARHFWTRRQAHETTVHRVDAELAAGADPAHLSPIDPALAADGIEELAAGFHSRASRVHSTVARTLRLRATDAREGTGAHPGSWTLTLSKERLAVRRDAEGPCDCELRGTTAQLYLTLWNRLAPGAGGPALEGDPAVAELWRDTSAIG